MTLGVVTWSSVMTLAAAPLPTLITSWKCLPYHTSLTGVLSRYMASRTKTYQFIREPKKINRVTILSHHDHFRRRRRITSSMKNTAATPGLPQSPSPTRNLRPSCRLVRSNSHYFVRNHTISTMWFLLHDGHHDATQRRWEFCQCKLFFIMF
jgi:hypothetical protein